MTVRHLLTILLILLQHTRSYAQAGCTDPYATNYNPGANTNDGSCLYPVTHDTMQLRTQLPIAITESSGLAWDNGKLWTHNDSGNPSTFFSIDTSDGHILQTVYVDNHSNVDWEDITTDNDYIYIGDFGNNNGNRTNLRVLRISKADIGNDTAVHVNADLIAFSYSDQTSFTSNQLNNYDCESIISIGDSLYIFTKDRLDQQTRVYKMPKVPGTYSLSPYTSYNVGGLITAASYNTATHEIVLLGYTLLKTNSFLWFLNDYNGNMFFSGNKRRIEIGDNSEWQTEGIEFMGPNRFFISNETATVNASLFIGEKNWLSSLGLSNQNIKQNTIGVFPNPVGDTFYLTGIDHKMNYLIRSMDGRIITTGSLDPVRDSIHFSKAAAGKYLLELENGSGNKQVLSIIKK
ncbi:MAG: hypothetical protein BGO69_14575 [Bacteroidetes bacterium 46-16]|nr:MAG: hypothetical protein BGO69_14575 [Bacteroidetes bacterium 46-16]